MSEINSFEEISREGLIDMLEESTEKINDLLSDLVLVEKNYDALQSSMPCGHLARYAVNEEDGTQYCAICVLEATQLTITNLVNDDESESETRLYELADKITNHDNGQECPYCYKTEWGKEKHAPDCPFAIAYDVLDKKDGRK